MEYFRNEKTSVADRVNEYLQGQYGEWLRSGNGYFLFIGSQQKDIAAARDYLKSLGFKVETVMQFSDKAYQRDGFRLYLNPKRPVYDIHPRTGVELQDAYLGTDQ